MKSLTKTLLCICLFGIGVFSSCVVRPVASAVVVKPARQKAVIVTRPTFVVAPAPMVVVRGHRHHRRHCR